MMYAITLTEAELDVVSLALGRMLNPKPITPRKPLATKAPRKIKSKPPTLSRGQFEKVSERWAKAVADPAKWHAELQDKAAGNTNRTQDEVLKAWGL